MFLAFSLCILAYCCCFPKHGVLGKLHQGSPPFCEVNTKSNPEFAPYFHAMRNVYESPNSKMHTSSKSSSLLSDTCLKEHFDCGWSPQPKNGLPTFVLSVGLEGAGHHLWTEILDVPVFDCVWTNGRHYKRSVGDGVPRTTVHDLQSGFQEMLKLRTDKGMKPCTSIYDAEDSFPTGAIRRHGRLFMRPDIINLQKLDGVMFNVKYLILLRNVTDTAMSALRRNFVNNVDSELRAVEHTLTYIESALKRIPCHKVFIGHYEHVLADPKSYIQPLAAFLDLNSAQRAELSKRLDKPGESVSRKVHRLTQYPDCKGAGLGDDVERCYKALSDLLDDFFLDRGYMWPTFAANGFDHSSLT